jgi:arsenite methyltransferase
VSGALAESVFVKKLHNVGFAGVDVNDRMPFGLDTAALYPLFSGELITQMRRVLPADRHDRVATSVLVTAVRPA